MDTQPFIDRSRPFKILNSYSTFSAIKEINRFIENFLESSQVNNAHKKDYIFFYKLRIRSTYRPVSFLTSRNNHKETAAKN